MGSLVMCEESPIKVHPWRQEEEAGSVPSCYLALYLLCTQSCSARAQPKCMPVSRPPDRYWRREVVGPDSAT